MIEFNQDKYKLYRCLNYFKPERILIVFTVIFFTLLTVSAQANNTQAGIDVEVSFNEIGISEHYAYMQKNIGRGDTTWNLTAADYPDVFCCEGSMESLDFVINGPFLTINDSNFVYRTLAYERDGCPFIVWLGDNYTIVDNETEDWYLSELIINENINDAHLLTADEPLLLPEGFAITVVEIDVDGEEVWISISQDGEEKYSSVRGVGEEFIYMEDLNENNNEDNWVLRFNIETVFQGMNSNIVKINELTMRSTDVVTIKTPDKDIFDGYIVTEFGTSGLQIKLDTGEKIELKRGGVVNLICKMFRFGLDIDGDVGGILKNTNYWDYAYMQNNIIEGDTIWNLTAADYPDVFYEGSMESLDFVINGPFLTINDSNFVYRTLAYERDGCPFIVWLGEKYTIVDNETEDWYLSELIINESINDAHLLTADEPLLLPEGFAITVVEIDVDSGEVWISISQDGEEKYSSVRGEGEEFIYMEDLNENNNEDNWVLRFNIETVFQGMNSNIVKINGLTMRSTDVVTIKTPDKDIFDGYIVTEFDTSGLQIKLDTGEEIELIRGGVVNLICEMFRFGLDIDGDVGGILKNTNTQGIWNDVAYSPDTNTTCGVVTNLSEFVVVEPVQNFK